MYDLVRIQIYASFTRKKVKKKRQEKKKTITKIKSLNTFGDFQNVYLNIMFRLNKLRCLVTLSLESFEKCYIINAGL